MRIHLVTCFLFAMQVYSVLVGRPCIQVLLESTRTDKSIRAEDVVEMQVQLLMVLQGRVYRPHFFQYAPSDAALVYAVNHILPFPGVYYATHPPIWATGFARDRRTHHRMAHKLLEASARSV